MTDPTLLTQGRPAEILLVEDNEDDVILTREGFRRARFLTKLHHVGDGEQCMRYLRKEGEFVGAPTPDLILLDMNMPVMDGREVLAAIVRDTELRKLPVVILTTSDDEHDMHLMYDLRCSSYVKKPVDFDAFRKAIQDICDYWFTIVVLPTKL